MNCSSSMLNVNRSPSMLVVYSGDSGLGKTTYVNTLFTTTVLQPKQRKRNGDTGEDSSVERVPSLPRTVNIEITKAGRNCVVVHDVASLFMRLMCQLPFMRSTLRLLKQPSKCMLKQPHFASLFFAPSSPSFPHSSLLLSHRGEGIPLSSDHCRHAGVR